MKQNTLSQALSDFILACELLGVGLVRISFSKEEEEKIQTLLNVGMSNTEESVSPNTKLRKQWVTAQSVEVDFE